MKKHKKILMILILMLKVNILTEARPVSVAAPDVKAAPFNSKLIGISLFKPALKNFTILLLLESMQNIFCEKLHM